MSYVNRARHRFSCIYTPIYNSFSLLASPLLPPSFLLLLPSFLMSCRFYAWLPSFFRPSLFPPSSLLLPPLRFPPSLCPVVSTTGSLPSPSFFRPSVSLRPRVLSFLRQDSPASIPRPAPIHPVRHLLEPLARLAPLQPPLRSQTTHKPPTNHRNITKSRKNFQKHLAESQKLTTFALAFENKPLGQEVLSETEAWERHSVTECVT